MESLLCDTQAEVGCLSIHSEVVSYFVAVKRGMASIVVVTSSVELLHNR